LRLLLPGLLRRLRLWLPLLGPLLLWLRWLRLRTGLRALLRRRLLLLAALRPPLLRLLWLGLLGALRLGLALLWLCALRLLRLRPLWLSLLRPLRLLLLLSGLGALRLRLAGLWLCALRLLRLRALWLSLLSPLRLLLLSGLRALLLRRPLLRLALRALLWRRRGLRLLRWLLVRLTLPPTLRVRRDQRPDKQKQGGGTGNSNELHGNPLRKGRYGLCTRTTSPPNGCAPPSPPRLWSCAPSRPGGWAENTAYTASGALSSRH
jgi:hypothetical protein